MKTHQSTSRVLIACIFMFVKLFMECGECVRTRVTLDTVLLFLFGFLPILIPNLYVFFIESDYVQRKRENTAQSLVGWLSRQIHLRI